MSTVLFRSLALLLAAGVVSAGEWNKKYTLTGTADLHMETTDASVVVRGGDVNWIESRVTTRGWSIGPSGVVIVESQTGDRVDISVRVPKEFFGIGERSAHVDLIVPRKLSAVIRTGDGKIVAERFGGDVHLSSGDGGIETQLMDGSLDAQTMDGRLVISGRFDRLNLRTKDGRVDVKAARGSTVGGPWRVQTGDGAVEVSVDGAFACDLDASTSDGEVSVDLPLTMSQKKHGSSFRAKVNGGGAPFVIRTGDGSIHVRKNVS